jgi:hypothetical protein
MGGLKSFWLMSVPSRRQNARGVLALASELCEALKPLLVPFELEEIDDLLLSNSA